jgi:hypothetical protein
MTNIRGACLCKSVRYTSDAEPAAVVVCHCDPSWVKPSTHLWCGEKQPWVAIEHGATQLPKGFS